MNYSNSWYEYIANLHQHIQQQDARIRELEQKIQQIESKSANQTTIEKLEYHFDQLKIERLDGTLHIGLSPEDLSKVEDMSMNQVPMNQMPPPNQTHQPSTGKFPHREQGQNDPNHFIKQQLVSNLDSYLTNEGPHLIDQYARQYEYPINNDYKEVIINDVRKQLPERISYYDQEARNHHTIQSEHDVTSYIFDKVQKEITHSLQKFFKKDYSKGD